LPGVDGLLHISDMSWGRVSHPSEIFNIDDVIDVTIKSVNKDTQKIALGYRKIEDNPWLNIDKNFKVNDKVEVTVKSIATFGAFCKVKDGVEGLIHISQISNKRLANVSDVLKVGQTVEAWILSVDETKKRVNLTMKEPIQIPEGAVISEEIAPETPVAETVE
jgi:4-hydroxy-3-methylbut-2-enyl diphosphate reductase